jgi:hypothetical protein
MFEDVVIPLDGSEFAATALPVGLALAREAGARAHVIGIASTDAELAWTYAHVHDDAKRAGLDPTDVEVRVDPQPVEVLLHIASDERKVLCLASHDRAEPPAKLMKAVASQVIARTHHPMVVVGSHGAAPAPGAPVVVAVDGVRNAEPLLAVAAAWTLSLKTTLRIVTVYEPVPPDVRRAEHYRRSIGPPDDPEIYLAAMRERVADVGVDRIDTEAIAHPINAGRGLEEHLRSAPAALLVLGNRHRPHPVPNAGVVHHMVRHATSPLLLVGLEHRN